MVSCTGSYLLKGITAILMMAAHNADLESTRKNEKRNSLFVKVHRAMKQMHTKLCTAKVLSEQKWCF